MQEKVKPGSECLFSHDRMWEGIFFILMGAEKGDC